FGEVQVMDWGFAKVLKRGGPDGASAPMPADAPTHVTTTRRISADDDSRAGTVFGTPRYMPPEQARGELDRVDERSDVFALGAILCEVLRGRPPYAGHDPGEVTPKAARGDLADAGARLDACRSDPDLIGLAKECLAPAPEARPRHAGAVAERV